MDRIIKLRSIQHDVTCKKYEGGTYQATVYTYIDVEHNLWTRKLATVLLIRDGQYTAMGQMVYSMTPGGKYVETLNKRGRYWDIEKIVHYTGQASWAQKVGNNTQCNVDNWG